MRISVEISSGTARGGTITTTLPYTAANVPKSPKSSRRVMQNGNVLPAGSSTMSSTARSAIFTLRLTVRLSGHGSATDIRPPMPSTRPGGQSSGIRPTRRGAKFMYPAIPATARTTRTRCLIITVLSRTAADPLHRYRAKLSANTKRTMILLPQTVCSGIWIITHSAGRVSPFSPTIPIPIFRIRPESRWMKTGCVTGGGAGSSPKPDPSLLILALWSSRRVQTAGISGPASRIPAPDRSHSGPCSRSRTGQILSAFSAGARRRSGQRCTGTEFSIPPGGTMNGSPRWALLRKYSQKSAASQKNTVWLMSPS